MYFQSCLKPSLADNLALIPDGVNVILAEFMPTFYIASNGTKARLIVLLIIRRRRNYLIVEQSSAVNYCDFAQ